MKLVIKLDMRERDLISIFEKTITDDKLPSLNFTYCKDNLPLGDVVVVDQDTGREILLFERKTLVDLAASIRDGRYKEQSFRLMHSTFHPHNIVYIIEGDIFKYNQFYTKVDKSALASAQVSLSYFKGFSIARTQSIQETFGFLINMVDKIHREFVENGLTAYYKNRDVPQGDGETGGDHSADTKMTPNLSMEYVKVAKKVKKDNVTNENLGYIMMTQIPSMSDIYARAILEKFGGDFVKMATHYREHPDELKGIKYKMTNGKERAIPNNVIERLVKFINYTGQEKPSEPDISQLTLN